MKYSKVPCNNCEKCIAQDRKQPDVCERYFHDVPFEANFASDIPDLQSLSAMPGVDGFTMKVDALYKVSGCKILPKSQAVKQTFSLTHTRNLGKCQSQSYSIEPFREIP